MKKHWRCFSRPDESARPDNLRRMTNRETSLTGHAAGHYQQQRGSYIMMKRFILPCMVIFTMLVANGCAHPKPEFNRTYLPNTVPGVTNKRIELTAELVDRSAGTGHPLFLYWVEEDNLLLSILDADRRKSLYSFLVTASTSEIKQLEDTEKDALLSKIEKKIIVDKTGSSVVEFVGFALQVTISLAGGGGGSGSGGTSHFLGNIENNGYALDIDATVRRSKWDIFPSAYNCSYQIKNRQTGRTLKGKARIKKQGSKQESLENWLKSWRISPDGRSYFIGKTATLIDSESKRDAAQSLIEHYSYVELDISPRWDQIALLVILEDEATRQVRYWIEFYPFWYRNTK